MIILLSVISSQISKLNFVTENFNLFTCDWGWFLIVVSFLSSFSKVNLCGLSCLCVCFFNLDYHYCFIALNLKVKFIFCFFVFCFPSYILLFVFYITNKSLNYKLRRKDPLSINLFWHPLYVKHNYFIFCPCFFRCLVLFWTLLSNEEGTLSS